MDPLIDSNFDSNPEELGTQQVIQVRHRIPLHRRKDMGVDVHCDRYLTVTQNFLDHLRISSEAKQKRGRCMAQVMESDRR